MASDDSPQIPLNDFLGLKEPVPSPAERRARLRAAGKLKVPVATWCAGESMKKKAWTSAISKTRNEKI